jgi:hypothetical protein
VNWISNFYDWLGRHPHACLVLLAVLIALAGVI